MGRGESDLRVHGLVSPAAGGHGAGHTGDGGARGGRADEVDIVFVDLLYGRFSVVLDEDPRQELLLAFLVTVVEVVVFHARQILQDLGRVCWVRKGFACACGGGREGKHAPQRRSPG